MQQINLLPCPHCGAPAEYDSRRWDGIRPWGDAHTGHAVYCTACPLPSAGGCVIYETKDEAVAIWNARHLTPQQQAAPEMYTELESVGEVIAALRRGDVLVCDVSRAFEDRIATILAKARGEVS